MVSHYGMEGNKSNMYFHFRILKLDDNIANFWVEFAVNGKDKIKVRKLFTLTLNLQT